MKISGNIIIGKIVNQPGSSFNGELQEKYNVIIPGFVARNFDGSLELYVDVKDTDGFKRLIFSREGDWLELNQDGSYSTISVRDEPGETVPVEDVIKGDWVYVGLIPIKLDKDLFMDVKWEDDYPTEVTIKIM